MFYTASNFKWVKYHRWRPSMFPWFYLWVGPGMLWLTLWLDILWAAVTGRPLANSLHGWLSHTFNTHFTLNLDSWCSTVLSHQSLSHRMVISTPFGILSYLLLWFVPRGSMSETVSVLWFLTAACLFESLMTVSCWMFAGTITFISSTFHR